MAFKIFNITESHSPGENDLFFRGPFKDTSTIFITTLIIGWRLKGMILDREFISQLQDAGFQVQTSFIVDT